MDAGLGLQQVQLVRHLQCDVGDLAAAVGAIRLESAEVDLGEIVVGAALLGGHADLGRGGVVVHLDPQAAEQFLGLFPIKAAVGQTLVVEGLQVLVEVAGGHGVPAVQFGDGAEMDEPVHLQGLVKGTRPVCRHPAADKGDLFEFRPTSGIGLRSGHLLGKIGMPLGKKDDGLAGDIHGPELLGLIGGSWRRQGNRGIPDAWRCAPENRRMPQV